MVTSDERDELNRVLSGKRLQRARPGFKAALLRLFGVDETASFALVDGDAVVLGIRASGLVVVKSERDDYERWSAHVDVVPFDQVEIEVDYNDPSGGAFDARSVPLAHAKVTVRGDDYGVTVTSEMGREGSGSDDGSESLAWVRALVRAKVGSAVIPAGEEP